MAALRNLGWRCGLTFTRLHGARRAGETLQDGMTVQRMAALRPVPAPIGGLVTA